MGRAVSESGKKGGKRGGACTSVRLKFLKGVLGCRPEAGTKRRHSLHA